MVTLTEIANAAHQKAMVDADSSLAVKHAETLQKAVKQRLGVDCTPTGNSVVIDGLTFKMNGHGHCLLLMAACPGCACVLPKGNPINSVADLGKAIAVGSIKYHRCPKRKKSNAQT